MDPKQLRKLLREELTPIVKEELKPVIKTQKEHTKILTEHTEKIDAITAELHHVHKLASTTLDVVKGRYENNKREIDEIKDNLGLHKEPVFGD